MGNTTLTSFDGCYNFRTLVIGDSVQNVPSKAFFNCSSLTSIRSKATNPPIVQGNSFYGVSKTIPFYVPCNSISSYNSALYWSDFTNYKCNPIGLDDELKFSVSTKLYPNPTSNKAILEVEGLKSDADVIVSDLLGRVIKSYKINPTNNELEIDVNGFAKGVYNIRIMNDNINQTKKLIVQ